MLAAHLLHPLNGSWAPPIANFYSYLQANLACPLFDQDVDFLGLASEPIWNHGGFADRSAIRELAMQ
jgi:hypothetical protein